MAIDLGRFRAGSALAKDESLGSVYRLLSDLSMPHFGSTTLEVAPDSNLQKLSIVFAEDGFHLGWAELISGWLLTLADIQISAIVSSGILHVEHEEQTRVEAYSRETAATLANRRRCYVEEVSGRFLLHNFRRTAAASPRRVVL
jgi:hypothetical protein